jgi:hypothetical protein
LFDRLEKCFSQFKTKDQVNLPIMSVQCKSFESVKESFGESVELEKCGSGDSFLINGYVDQSRADEILKKIDDSTEYLSRTDPRMQFRIYGKTMSLPRTSQCAVDSRFVNSMTVTGHTGSCFSWTNGKWGVIQFTVGNAGVLYLFDDAQCQNRSTPNYSALSGDVGKCSYVGQFNGSGTYALVVHASTPAGALATVHALSPNITSITGSSSSSTAAAGGPDSANDNSSTSAPFPITKLGLIIGGCVAVLLLAFLVWCWHDYTRKSSPAIHPVDTQKPSPAIHPPTHQNISIECTTIKLSQACKTV